MSCSQIYTVITGAELPVIESQLWSDRNDAPVKLSGAYSISFIMVAIMTGEIALNEVAEIVDSENGIVRYQFKNTETDTTGKFRAYFCAVIDEKQEFFPGGNDELIIEVQRL